VLVVDAANVIGSRPTGWWRDRAGAARTFVERLQRSVEANVLDPPVTVVLEGQARGGVASGEVDGVTVVHAAGSGDDALVAVVADAADAADAADGGITLVTADRELRGRAEALGATVVGPGWLLSLLDREV
jgi:hypothetical protein